MKPNIGISEKDRSSSTDLLKNVLANEMTLYVKTRKAHWNAFGDNFMELHHLYKEHYELLADYADSVAERIGKLGKEAPGTMTEFMGSTSLKESPEKNTASKEMLKELLLDHETLIIQLRKGAKDCAKKHKDAGSADFLTFLLEEHETIAWVLRRYLN